MSLQEEFKRLTLDNVANGAAIELFDKALGEVLDNIMDENRPAESKRTITLKIELRANRERNMGVITVECDTKLVPVQAAEATMYMRQEKGKPAAYGHNIHQPSLFDSNVAPISGKDRAARNDE